MQLLNILYMNKAVQCKVHSVQCTLCTLHCTLCTIYKYIYIYIYEINRIVYAQMVVYEFILFFFLITFVTSILK